MITTRLRSVAALSVAAILGWSALGLAQAPTPAKPKDDALEDLLKQAEAGSKPKDSAAADKAKAKDQKDDAKKDTPKKGAAKPGELSTKDKELDDLLGKVTEKDKPTADDKNSEPPPPGAADDKKSDKPDNGKPGDKDKKASKPKDPLKGDDAELDDHLAGNKKPKPGQKKGQGQGQGKGQGQGEEDGPLGDLIKQMREVEQRLGKPDTGEETRQKQTEIVKKLDTMIEQMRTRQVSMRQMRQGKQPGQPGQPGQQPGAMAQGAPPMRPETTRVSPLGLKDKDAWGHLQQALRDEMENVFKEKALPTREDLIKRYYMAVAKKSLSKGE